VEVVGGGGGVGGGGVGWRSVWGIIANGVHMYPRCISFGQPKK